MTIYTFVWSDMHVAMATRQLYIDINMDIDTKAFISSCFPQVALSFIFENLLTTKLKVMPEAWPFLKPVNKKQVKDYYNVIKKPIDMETIGKKIQGITYYYNDAF